jgi:predicted nucleic acid-binding protein
VSTYLLDTSVLVDALRGVRGRAEILERLVADGHLLACSAITVAELFAGMRPKERDATVTLLDSLEHYDITRPVAERAGLLRREWSARGRTLALPDLLIASVVMTHGLILVTDNAKDFPMKDLQLHDFRASH